MMFQGTYTSEFYRAVRNLIHDQVALQILEKDVPAGENSAAKRALERRWHDLLSRESLHRSQGARQRAWDGGRDGSAGFARTT
jgi:anaerobic magnesium-protoporphyrin IX monomethyl ester cyclase